MNSAPIITTAERVCMFFTNSLAESYADCDARRRAFIARTQKVSALIVKRMSSSEVRRRLGLSTGGQEFLLENELIIAQAKRIVAVLQALDDGQELELDLARFDEQPKIDSLIHLVTSLETILNKSQEPTT